MTNTRCLIAAAVALAAITATSACTTNDPTPTPSTATSVTSTTTTPTPSSTSLSPAEQDAKDAARRGARPTFLPRSGDLIRAGICDRLNRSLSSLFGHHWRSDGIGAHERWLCQTHTRFLYQVHTFTPFVGQDGSRSHPLSPLG